jgi:hypothetical protein
MKKAEPYRRWSVYMKMVSIWIGVTVGTAIAAIFGIFKGIHLVMDYFLRDDRFYEGFAWSVVVSACGTLILFVAVFILIRKIGRYPRRRYGGMKQI